MHNGQCLMIKTKDKRKFFTSEKNYIQLIEFSKMFNAEMSVVKVKEAEVLDLANLATALCDANYVQPQPVECKIIEVKIPQTRTRGEILNKSSKIKSYVREKFLSGEVVTLRDLSKEFVDLTVACLCNHLTKIRKDLEEEGHEIKKLGGGKYKLATA